MPRLQNQEPFVVSLSNHVLRQAHDERVWGGWPGSQRTPLPDFGLGIDRRLARLARDLLADVLLAARRARAARPAEHRQADRAQAGRGDGQYQARSRAGGFAVIRANPPTPVRHELVEGRGSTSSPRTAPGFGGAA